MKLSDYVFEFMQNKGVQTVFYVPGGGCMHLTDSLGKNDSIHEVNLLHEQSAAIATESYAFAGDTVGVCLVTTGPGGTNAVTGVLSAYVDSIPCVFISGQVKTTDLKKNYSVRIHGSQETDIVDMVQHITKYAVMIEDKQDIRFHLEKAWHEATTGRKGPVWVDIPLDIQGSDIAIETLKAFKESAEENNVFENEATLILEALSCAKRPIIIAGNGLRGYEEAFYKLADRLKVPIIPTWKAIDLIPNDHYLFAGKCGTLGERTGNFAMQNADVIISFGSRLDFSITGFDRTKWAVNAKKIVVDIDKGEIDKLKTTIDLKITGDVGIIIKTLNQKNYSLPSYDAWHFRIKEWLEKYPVGSLLSKKDDEGLISTYQLTDSVCKQIDDVVIVPASAGTVAEIFYQAVKIKKGQKVRSNHGLGAMGYEIPSAIGAYFATHKPVVVFAGDGGMQLNIQELSVIAGRNLPIKIFVVNNGGYASIRSMQRNHFEGHYVGSNEQTGLHLPDMAKLALAYGIKPLSVRNRKDLDKTVFEALSEKGPVICDVYIDNDGIVSPRVTSKVLDDGRIVSTMLEDLYPFLDKKT